MTKTILAISNHSEMVGGGEYSFLDLLAGLPGEWQPLAVVPAEGVLADRLRQRSVPTVVAPLPPIRPWHMESMLRSLQWLRRDCRRHRAELIYCNGSRAAFYGGLVSRLTGIPALWHCRVDEPDPLFDRVLGRLCTNIVANSRATGWRFSPRLQPKVRCIANGLDLGWLRQAVPLSGFEVEGRRLILVVARLTRWKAHEVVLGAFEHIARKESRTHLVCLGGEDQHDPAWVRHLKMIGARSTFADRIHWLGDIEDPRPWFQAASLLVHPSRNEPFGRVLVEAMACGIPVVAINNGGVPEIVRNNSDGFLVKQDSPTEIAESVIKLLTDERLRRHMGACAGRRAEDFSLQKHIAQMVSVFGEVSDDRTPAVTPEAGGKNGGRPFSAPTPAGIKGAPLNKRHTLVIDAREFLPGHMTGIGRVLLGLVEALCDWDLVGDIILALRSQDALPEVLRAREQIRWARIDPVPWAAERQLAQMAGAPHAVFLSPYPKLPMWGTFPMVHIIHDVLYLTHPQYKNRAKRLLDLFRLKSALGRAALTWYDSRASLEETRDLLGHAGRNPRVRFPGIDPKFGPGETGGDLAILQKHGLEPGYILVTGNGLPHKNIGILLRVADSLTRRLAIVGVSSKAQKKWLALNPRADAVWIERVDDDELPAFMRQAFCLAQPSTAEGYGLPPLEAMASGTPAVVSRIPVLSETTGGHAVFADPFDPLSWVQAFAALEAPETHRAMVGEGLNWAAPLQRKDAWAGYREDLDRFIAGELS